MGDIFDDEKGEVTTMQQYMEEMEAEELEELEADLALGGDEGTECTYPQGYLKRQALFSCLTCTPAGNAGICNACCENCHEDHQVVELRTKRQFRCDCGNSKFGGVHCKLVADKDSENIANVYNQNFKGLFCSCHQPYPDSDEEDQPEIIQCCICEDWFHENHLGLESTEKVPMDEEGEPTCEDFVCQDCVCNCPFLLSYHQNIIVPSILGESTTRIGIQKQNMQAENNEKDDTKLETSETIVTHDQSFVPEETFICTRNKSKGGDQLKQPCSSNAPDNDDQSVRPSCAGHEAENRMSKALSLIHSGVSLSDTNQVEGLASENKVASGCMTKAGYPSLENVTTPQKLIANLGLPLNHDTEKTDVQVQESECKLRADVNKTSISLERKKPLFLLKNWRKLLCRCSNCHDLYRTKAVSFLLDEGDTLEEYKNAAEQRRAEKLQQQEAAELELFQNLDHVHKIEFLHGLNEMTDELQSFLGSFDGTRVLTCADVDEFFQNLRRKRPRLD